MLQTEEYKLLCSKKNDRHLTTDHSQNKNRFNQRLHSSKSIVHKKRNLSAAFFILLMHSIAPAQILTIDKKKFFAEEQPVNMTLVTDFKKLFSEKLSSDYKDKPHPASITFTFNDSTKVTEEIEARVRGEFRREECSIPPLMINFKTSKANTFKKLGKLKLVWPCEATHYNEQLVFKEYLVYKIYNLISEKSFRVRLVKIAAYDSKKKYKPFDFFGFFIEDVDDMAKRNNCEEIEDIKFNTEQTNREQATLIGLFQYMIGNTDWAVPLYRNIKLIKSNNDSLHPPFIVPYDFDYCGLVNADYAIPVPELEISSVRERLYRGFTRTMEELQHAAQLFESKKDAIYSLVTNSAALTTSNKKDMTNYLDEFYSSIANEKNIKHFFIDKARKNKN